MFEQVLPKNTKTVLAILEKSEVIQRAYLAGGTALALQIGHRMSYDLDFFTQEEFEAEMLLSGIKKISNFQLEKIAWRTVLGRIKDVRFSIFYYQYALLYTAKRFGMIRITDVRDIAAMKVAAISSRGTKRDFVYLYFICEKILSLPEVIRLYDKKYKNLSTTKMHIMKSLVYFDDADPDEMPKMLKKVNWENVKKYFESEVKKLQ